MKVHNVHERRLPRPRHDVAALLFTLASSGDRIWPRASWPRMELDHGLKVGSRGGHGPIRYVVEFVDEEVVRFRFTGPRGFDGYHELRLVEEDERGTLLRHVVRMHTSGRATFAWALIFRPMHDALVEDAFTTAEINLGVPVHIHPWPWSVRFLRSMLRRGRSSDQRFPTRTAPVPSERATT